MSKKKKIYPDLSCEFRTSRTKKPLTIADCKSLLGWEEEPAEEKKSFGADYKFRDVNGKKIRLNNNPNNRPFRIGLARKYANEVLRKKWECNGEGLIFDWFGNVQSGQHRLVGFIFAEQMRVKASATWKEKGWKGPITIDALLVFGIDPSDAVVDTLDVGQKRTLGDVVFRRQEFGDCKEAEAKKLANVLAIAIRLVWERQGGKVLSDAGHFPHSEALDFLEEHPKMIESAKFIYNLEGGTGADNRLISNFLALGFATGLHYLMSCATTDPDEYLDLGVDCLDFELREQADEFWTHFAHGVGEKGDVLFGLRNLLPRIEPAGAIGRMEVIGAVIKAFNLWVEDKPLKSANQLKVKAGKDDKGKKVLEEMPRIGGIDTERDIPVDEDEGDDGYEEEVEEPQDQTLVGKKKGKAWAKGDKAWVYDSVDKTDHWFGTVTEVYASDYGMMAMLKSSEDGEEYEAEVKDLRLEYPVDLDE